MFGTGGDVARQLPRLREDLAKETFCRLLPGYTRHFVENATPLVGIQITGDLDGCFAFRSAVSGGMDPLLHTLELYMAIHSTPSIRSTVLNAVTHSSGE